MILNLSSILIIAFLAGSSARTIAQDSLPPKSDSVYTKVDVLPEFPGGMKALGKYVDGKNHHYPKRHEKTISKEK